MLASVACQAAIAVENASLHESALKTHALERDLDLAHKVQQGILPSAPPKIDGYEFFDYYDPASQVGGDYFDYVPLPGGRLAVVLADVSGKGMPAALVVARLSSEARYCLASEATPAEALNRLNTSFLRSGWEDRFVTMVVAVIDLERHLLTVANAGHMPPLLRRGDKSLQAIGVDETGVPLGVDSEPGYGQASVELAPGDCFTVFTDGISEAMDINNQLYGIGALAQAMVVSGSAAAFRQLGSKLLDKDVRRFVGTRPRRATTCA